MKRVVRVVNRTPPMYEKAMCGRFALGVPKKRLEEVFGMDAPDDYTPRYNVSPGQDILVVREESMAYRKWGLVPHWAKEASVGFRMINARSETVFNNPAFREPVRQSRCLIPLEAFYEWNETPSGKQPHAISIDNSDIFTMAGIAASWQDRETGEVLDSVAVLTCASNSLMNHIHGRMPVILDPQAWETWLDSSVARAELLSPLLVPCPASFMRAWSVSTAVNKVASEGKALLSRVGVHRQGSLI